MNGSILFRIVAVVLLIAVLVGGGAVIYDAGINAGLQQAAAQAASGGQPTAVAPYPYGAYRWGPGFAFGFVNFFVWILVFFLFIGLLRAAFGRGRWGGGGRWGGPSGPGGSFGPGGRGRRSIEDWHRELHRADEGGTPPAAG